MLTYGVFAVAPATTVPQSPASRCGILLVGFLFPVAATAWKFLSNLGTYQQVFSRHRIEGLSMPWFIKTKDGERGPLPTAKLKELVDAGKLSERVMIRRDGQQQWVQAGSIAGLFPESESAAEAPEPATSVVGNMASSIAGFAGSVSKMIPKSLPAASMQAVPVVAAVVDPVLKQFTLDDQPVAVVEKLVPKVKELLTVNEELQYIAVQSRPIVNFSPDCVALTSRRFMIVRPKMLGRLQFDDYIWRDLRNVQVQDDLIGATIRFQTVHGDTIAIDYLPKSQAKAIYRFAQLREEDALEERRNRKMEETRAGASQMVIQTAVQPAAPVAAPSAGPTPLERMQQLKQFLEAGLISQAEFDEKRAEIMKSL